MSLGFALTLGVFSFVGCGGSTEPAADTAAPATEAPAAEAPAAADTAAAAAPADTTKH
ncbi:MAG: hypothetical protein KA783_01505 [Chitinophagales bacterium]|nr:hypothetical protein [Chitinophagales bacterium]